MPEKFPQQKTKERSPEITNTQTLETLEGAESFLHNELSIDNLSNIETVRLKDLAKQCLETQRKEIAEMKDLNKRAFGDERVRQRMIRSANLLFEPTEEAVARWLQELYGIKWDDIPRSDIILDEKGNILHEEIVQKNEEFYRTTTDTPNEDARKANLLDEKYDERRRLIEKKAKEFQKAGYKVEIKEWQVPNSFKEYLRRLRDEAHLL